MFASEVHSTVGDLAGALELVMDRAAIASIVTDLHETISDLDARAAALAPADGSEFGGSAMGAFVAGHTGKAYTAVMESMGDMNTAMQHYIATLKGLEKDTTTADEVGAAASNELTAAVECTTTASGGAGTCTPSGAGS